MKRSLMKRSLNRRGLSMTCATTSLVAVLCALLLAGAGGCADEGAGAGAITVTTSVSTTVSAASTTTTAAAEPATTTTAAVTTATTLSERLQAVIGITTAASGGDYLWYVAAYGVFSTKIHADSVVAVGDFGWNVVFTDPATGDVCLWYPEVTPDDEAVSRIEVPGGDSLGDMLALSPDETQAALVRTYPPAEGASVSAAPDTRGYLVDLISREARSMEWLDSIIGGRVVTELHWNPTSTAFYVSLGQQGGSQGEVSYRYDLWTGEVTELAGVAAVFDVGLLDQVIGLGMPSSPEEYEYVEGSSIGYFPLVLWQDGALMTLPRDPDLVSWDDAWIADGGYKIVVKGASNQGGARSCLEILRLGEDGWDVDRLFTGPDSIYILYGVGFEPGSDVFSFQAGGSPAAPGGVITDSCLYELDTDLGRAYSPPLRLPGESDDWIQTLGIVGAGSCGST